MKMLYLLVVFNGLLLLSIGSVTIDIKTSEYYIEVDALSNRGVIEEKINYYISSNRTTTAVKPKNKSLIVQKLIPNLDNNFKQFEAYGLNNVTVNSYEIKQNYKNFILILTNITVPYDQKSFSLSYTYDIKNVFKYNQLTRVSNIEVSNLNAYHEVKSEFFVFLANFPESMNTNNINFPDVDYEFGYFSNWDLKYLCDLETNQNSLSYNGGISIAKNYDKRRAEKNSKLQVNKLISNSIKPINRSRTTNKTLNASQEKNFINKTGHQRSSFMDITPLVLFESHKHNKLTTNSTNDDSNLRNSTKIHTRKPSSSIRTVKDKTSKRVFLLNFKKTLEKDAIQRIKFEITLVKEGLLKQIENADREESELLIPTFDFDTLTEITDYYKHSQSNSQKRNDSLQMNEPKRKGNYDHIIKLSAQALNFIHKLTVKGQVKHNLYGDNFLDTVEDYKSQKKFIVIKTKDNENNLSSDIMILLVIAFLICLFFIFK